MAVRIRPELLLHIPRATAVHVARDLLEQHWTVSIHELSDTTYILGKRTQPSGWDFAPERLEWRWKPHGQGTLMECRFMLNQRLLIVACAVLLLTMPVIALTTLANIRFPNVVAFPALFAMVATLGRWVSNTEGTQLLREFCAAAEKKTGAPINVLQPALLNTATPQVPLAATATLGIIMVCGMLSLDAWKIVWETHIPWMILAVGIQGAIVHTIGGFQRLYYHLPYICGIIALSVFCSWPAFITDLQRLPQKNSVGAYAYFAVVCAGTAGFLRAAGKLLNEVRQHRLQRHIAALVQPNGWKRNLVNVSILPLLAITLWTQYRALEWGISMLQGPTQEPVIRALNLSWAFSLATPYLVVLCHALHHAYQLLRAAAATDPMLRERCAELARDLQTRTPLVAVTDAAASHVDRIIPFVPIICLARIEVAHLTPDQRDALILHELAHAREHSTIFSILALIGNVSLFGRGLLSIAINTRDFEYQADTIAAKQLQVLGKHGKALVTATVWKLDSLHSTRPPPPTKTTSSVLALLLGDAAPWYDHPTALERAQSLRNAR